MNSEKIKTIAGDMGMKMIDLSKKLGISKGTLYNYLNDDTDISAKDLYKLSRLLDTSMEDLLIEANNNLFDGPVEYEELNSLAMENPTKDQLLKILWENQMLRQENQELKEQLSGKKAPGRTG